MLKIAKYQIIIIELLVPIIIFLNQGLSLNIYTYIFIKKIKLVVTALMEINWWVIASAGKTDPFTSIL